MDRRLSEVSGSTPDTINSPDRHPGYFLPEAMMTILEFRAEQYKRLTAVRIKTDGSPLVPLVGKNGAGKTSVLDAITETLGGTRGGAEKPVHEGADRAECFIDLGPIKIRRRWTAKGGDSLLVTNAEGLEYPKGASTLKELIGKLSFDPLDFVRLKSSEQRDILAQVAGLDLGAYNRKRDMLADERRLARKSLANAEAQANGMPEVNDAPEAEVKLSDLLAELDSATAANAAAQKAIDEADKLAQDAVEARNAATRLLKEAETERAERIQKMRDELAAFEAKSLTILKDYEKRGNEATELAERCQAKAESIPRVMIDTTPIRQRIDESESVNARFRAAKERAEKIAEVESTRRAEAELTERIEGIDAEMEKIVEEAGLPVAGLKLSTDGVLLNGIPFGQASGAEKLRVSVALGIAQNPKLRVMLIRDGSLLDAEGMAILEEMAEKHSAQIWIERVDTRTDPNQPPETGILIVDGENVELTAATVESSEQ